MVNLTSTGATISSYEYELDDIGRRLSVTDHNGNIRNWSYDCASRLVSQEGFVVPGWCDLSLSGWDQLTVTGWSTLGVCSTAGARHTYSYDPVGNRHTEENPDVGTTTSSYDAANRLTRTETVSGYSTYSYDEAGNRLSEEKPSGDIITHVWSPENELVRVEQPDGELVSLTSRCRWGRVEQIKRDAALFWISAMADTNGTSTGNGIDASTPWPAAEAWELSGTHPDKSSGPFTRNEVI